MSNANSDELQAVNDLVNKVYSELWVRKGRGELISQIEFDRFPVMRFDVSGIFKGILEKHKLTKLSHDRIAGILSDLKFLMYFIDSIDDFFSLGITRIVGNSEYEKVGLNTLSLLQGNHYRVYLITLIYERTLDLLELIEFDRLTDTKRNKWGKKYEIIRAKSKNCPIEKAQHELLIELRDKTRRAEIHGLSSTFRQLKAPEWNHFQQEERAVTQILISIAQMYSEPKDT